jgi:hypothetical protein
MPAVGLALSKIALYKRAETEKAFVRSAADLANAGGTPHIRRDPQRGFQESLDFDAL